MIFLTTQTAHLASHFKLPPDVALIKKFSDGELYVKIDQKVKQKQVWIVASTFPPAESLLELFFLIDALDRAGAYVNVLITYFGYARQDRAEPGEALAASVICNFLKTFKLNKIVIIHVHSSRIASYLTFENKIPLDLFCLPAEETDRIAAPDQGAYDFAQALGRICGKESVIITKMRPEQEQVKITQVIDNIEHKNILIVDDIISTGNTLLSTAQALKKRGAHKIYAAATHGIFSEGALQRIQESDLIERVYVSNTLAQENRPHKIHVLNIVPVLEKVIEEHR